MSTSVPGPRQRRAAGVTVEVTIGGEPVMVTTGRAPDGTLCRVDLRAGVHGSTLAGFADALATAITLGLQHGAPGAAYVGVVGLALDAPAEGDAGQGRVLLDAFSGTGGAR